MNNQEMRTISALIELKQEEGLLKQLFKPLWETVTATAILIILCFIFSGSFFAGVLLSPAIAVGIYMSRKCRKRLKEIKRLQEL